MFNMNAVGKSFANCVTTFLDGDIEYIYFDVQKVPIVLSLLVIRNVRTVEDWSYNLDNPNFQIQECGIKIFPYFTYFSSKV